MKDIPATLSGFSRRLRDGDLCLTELGDGSGVILDLDGHQVLTLNASGVVLVGAIAAGTLAIDDLVKILREQFDVDEILAERDVQAFLEELGGYV